jgi:hypothetical protein
MTFHIDPSSMHIHLPSPKEKNMPNYVNHLEIAAVTKLLGFLNSHQQDHNSLDFEVDITNINGEPIGKIKWDVDHDEYVWEFPA